MNEIYYKVGSQTFYNRYLAFLEARRTGQKLNFVLYESAFDAADWNEPIESWETLLDQRAQQLASLNKPIILGFSGGTDSLTIYNVFKRNNIKIYGAFVNTRNDILSRDVVPFIQNEGKEQGFKVFILTQGLAQFTKEFETPEWIFSDLNPRPQLGMNTFADLNFQREYFGFKVNEDYIHVIGMEKPRICVVGNTFYSYQDDTPYSTLADSRIHTFYISGDFPKLHIKQSYMLARLIKKLSMESGKTVANFQNIHNAKEFDYYRYCYEGCGRHGDLAFSKLQKIANLESTLYLPEFDSNKLYLTQGFKDANVIVESLKDNKKFLKNYFEGLKLLRADSIIKDIFQDAENYFSVRPFHSKHYRLSI